MTMSFTRGLLLAGIETSFNVEEPLDGDDVFEVLEPAFNPDVTFQERPVTPEGLSGFGGIQTRMVARVSFKLEIKGNGDTTGTLPPRIGRLLRACGMAETAITTAEQCVYRVTADPTNTGDMGFYGETVYTGGVMLKFRVDVLDGGISGYNNVGIQHPAEAEAANGIAEVRLTDSSEQTLIDGQELVLGRRNQIDVGIGGTATMTYNGGAFWQLTWTGLPLIGAIDGVQLEVGDVVEIEGFTDPLNRIEQGEGWDVSFISPTTKLIRFQGQTFGAGLGTNEGPVAGPVSIFALGTTGPARITPDFQSNLPAAGDAYSVYIRPIGTLYTPTTNNIPSLTLVLHYTDDTGEALTHKMTGCRGSVVASGEVGEVPVFEFEFVGSYVDAEDSTPPVPNYEGTQPVGVEYAALAVAKRYGPKVTDLCASAWEIDFGNDVVARDSVNDHNGTKGAAIAARRPSMNLNVEAVRVSEVPLWTWLEGNQDLEWWLRHGTEDGNTVIFHAPAGRIRGLGYANRNGIRDLLVDLSLGRLHGDDEYSILFT